MGRHRIAVRSLLVLALAVAGSASAFRWAPFEFPAGDQRYVLEIRQGEGDAAMVGTVDLTIVDRGGVFDATTTIAFAQTGLSPEDLSSAAFGGAMANVVVLGPALAYGPAFFLLPMMLGEEEVRVRPEPIRLVGIGSLHMEREEVVAGRTCVVVRYEPDGDPSGAMTFALADGLPFPCFSMYGSGDGRVEVRLLRAD
jgi:hypothetical protein